MINETRRRKQTVKLGRRIDRRENGRWYTIDMYDMYSKANNLSHEKAVTTKFQADELSLFFCSP